MTTISTKYANLHYFDDKEIFIFSYNYKNQYFEIDFWKDVFLNFFNRYDKNFTTFIYFLEIFILKNRNIKIKKWSLCETANFFDRLKRQYDLAQKSYNLPKLQNL